MLNESDLDFDGRGKPRISTDGFVGHHKKQAEYTPRKVVPSQHGHSMVLPTETTDKGLHVVSTLAGASVLFGGI